MPSGKATRGSKAEAWGPTKVTVEVEATLVPTSATAPSSEPKRATAFRRLMLCNLSGIKEGISASGQKYFTCVVKMKDGGKDTWWGDESVQPDGSKFSKCTPGPGHFLDPFDVVVAVIDSNEVVLSVRQKYLRAMIDEIRARAKGEGGGEHCERARFVLTSVKEQSIKAISLSGFSSRAQVEKLCGSVPVQPGLASASATAASPGRTLREDKSAASYFHDRGARKGGKAKGGRSSSTL